MFPPAWELLFFTGLPLSPSSSSSSSSLMAVTLFLLSPATWGKGHLEFMTNFSRTRPSFSQMITNDFDFSLEIITARLCLAFLILFPIGVLRHSSSPSSSLSSELQKRISETWQVWCWVGAKRWPVSDRFKNELALYLDEDPNSSKYSSSVYLELVDVSRR